MGSLVTYALDDTVATITMDDGKANVLSLAMLGELNAALDQALADRAVVVLAGRDGRFSGGFDLPTLQAGGPDAVAMLQGGFLLAERLLSFPLPVVIACTGHAIAMAVFLLLSGDYRIGADGAFKITANEVAIGMVLPWAAIEICRHRLTPTHYHRAVSLAEVFTPAGAVEAGFLDQVAAPNALLDEARTTAAGLAGLDLDAHAATKLRARREALADLRTAIEADAVDLGAALAE